MLGPAARFVNLDCYALRLSSHRGRRWEIARRYGEVELEGLSLQAHGTAGRSEVWCLGIGARGKRLEADETSAGPTIPWNGSASANIVVDGNTFTFQSGFYYEMTIVTHRAIELSQSKHRCLWLSRRPSQLRAKAKNWPSTRSSHR